MQMPGSACGQRSDCMLLSAQPIQRGKSLYEQTYQALRASILSGELAAGDRIVETQLAQQLHVSRTPIREAVRQLQKEGLATSDASGGLRVTAISVADAVYLYDCRMALEQLSVASACQQASSAQLQILEQYVVQAEALTLGRSVELSSTQLLELDYQFHRSIAEGSGNKWLVTLLDQVFDKMTLLRIQTTRHNLNVLEVRIEHRHIYEAIASREPDRAVQAVQQHLMSSKARVIQEVQQIQQRS